MQVSREVEQSIREQLDEIWKICKEAGTTNTSEIIAILAVLLTNGKAKVFREAIRPTKPRNSYNIDADILPLLKKLEEKIDSGTLFDRYILFQDARSEKTGTYPIPRHIVDCMVNLLDISPTHSFADFTCGTGGFLVNSYRKDNLQRGTTVGIDISIDVIRLAVANAILHNMPAESTQFYVGNSLDLCETDPNLNGLSFDRIVMAPPFGIIKEKELVQRWTDKDGGHSSVDIFTRMALQKLKDQGMVAFIAPLSLTSRSNASMPALRQKLLQEYTIHAVISLPENALAPFNASSRVCMLFVQNQRPTSEHQPWLFKVQKDGYRASLSRNLLTAPLQTSEENDFPFAEAVIKYRLTAKPSEVSHAYVTYKQPGIVDNKLLRGVVLCIGTQARLHMIRLFIVTRDEAQQSYLLITTSNEDQQAHYKVLPLTKYEAAKGTIQDFKERQAAREYLCTLMDMKQEKDLPEGQRIYQDGFSGQKLAIAQDGRLLGMTLPVSEIREPDYWLQPERYIPLPEVQFSTDSPVQQLDKFQQDHRLIANYVDSLLGQLEVKPVVGKDLPPSLLPTDSSLLNALGPEQSAIWEKVKQHTIDADGNLYALYFVPSQLYDEDTTSSRKLRVQQTLDLFVRMGLLLNVLVTIPGTNNRVSCYRCVTTHDLVELSAEGSEI